MTRSTTGPGSGQGTSVGTACSKCGSSRTTRLSMTLTDGTPVDFTSCHSCEGKSWVHNGRELDRDEVLAKAQKHK